MGLTAVTLAALATPGGARGDDLFDYQELQSTGRTVAAELADFDGDGRSDLLQIAYIGHPPFETREMRVFAQTASGRFEAQPRHTWPLPAGAAAYDLADVRPWPGVELILLRSTGLVVLSLAGPELRKADLRVQGAPTAAAVADERGLDRMPLARHGLADEPWLLVPLPGRAVAVTGDGTQRAELDVGARANYLIPPHPGPMMFESAIQVYLDVPHLSVSDVNGDGHQDIVACSRHELRVFENTAATRNGTSHFARAPTRIIPLAQVSEDDHVRGSGAVRSHVTDLDGDGRGDLIISHAQGALTDAQTNTSIFLNRNGDWNLKRPDQIFEAKRTWSADELIDLDADGHPELVRAGVRINVLELIEALLTRSLDANFSVYHAEPGGPFDPSTWAEWKIAVPISFDTFRPAGFVPTLQADMNRDGYPDFVASGKGDRIEVHLGGPEHRFRKRNGRQKLDSRGRASFGDIDGDGLQDLVMFEPRPADPSRGREPLSPPLRPGTRRARPKQHPG
jgi:hypothetical protein